MLKNSYKIFYDPHPNEVLLSDMRLVPPHSLLPAFGIYIPLFNLCVMGAVVEDISLWEKQVDPDSEFGSMNGLTKFMEHGYGDFALILIASGLDREELLDNILHESVHATDFILRHSSFDDDDELKARLNSFISAYAMKGFKKAYRAIKKAKKEGEPHAPLAS
jgi:hypothetical protein